MRVVKEEMDGTYGLMRWKSRGILSVRLSLRDSQEDWKRRLKIEALIYRNGPQTACHVTAIGTNRSAVGLRIGS